MALVAQFVEQDLRGGMDLDLVGHHDDGLTGIPAPVSSQVREWPSSPDRTANKQGPGWKHLLLPGPSHESE